MTGTGGATSVTGSGPTFLGHPLGLVTVFFTEMWERLSFYGMRALLILFLVDQVAHGGLGLDDRTAAAIYGLYVGGTYLACLPGGWIGDRLLGSQRAVLIGGIVITIGHLLLGFAPSTQVFFFGLLVIVIGTGLLKPNSAAIVAQLYPEGGARRDAGFTIYYVGINVGATLGPLIAGLLAVRYGWPAGFMTAAVGMAAGVVQFVWGRRLLGNAGRAPMSASGDAGADAAGSSAAALAGAPLPRAALGWLALAAVALVVLVVLLWNGTLHAAPVALQALTTQAVIAIAILYFGFIASDQFVSETRFMVRTASNGDSANLASFMQDQKITRATDETIAVSEFMTSRDALNAPAEQAEMSIGDAENAARAGAERVDHQFPIVGFNQQYIGNGGVGKMNAPHRRHLAGDADGVIQGKNNHFGGSGGNRLKDGGNIDGAGGNAELRAPAQGAGEKLRLHAIGVRNEDSDCGNGGGRRTHQTGLRRETVIVWCRDLRGGTDKFTRKHVT